MKRKTVSDKSSAATTMTTTTTKTMTATNTNNNNQKKTPTKSVANSGSGGDIDRNTTDTTADDDDDTAIVYKNGNLVRLLLKDFMTYKRVEITAGPHLNLVLGPNGTGKSALVCSIIIGLGGEPSTTGRSGHLGEYIRFGCDLALVEIELYNDTPNAKNYLIQRVIQKKTTSTSGKTEFTSSFKLNGREATRTAVREFTHQLNINVDNLCQFLPQERVLQFVAMDKKTLLECTEKAAGDQQMFDNHQQLVALAKDIKKLNAINSNLTDQISSEREQQARAEEELRRIEERDKYKTDIQWLVKKRPWIEYEDKRVEYQTAKDELLEKKQNRQTLQRVLDPLKSETNNARKAAAVSHQKKTDSGQQLASVAKSIEPLKVKIEQLFDKIREEKSRYFEQQNNDRKRLATLKKLESDLTDLRTQYENINEDDGDGLDTEAIDRQIQDIVKRLHSLNKDIEKSNQSRVRLKEERDQLAIQKNGLEVEKRNIEDIFRKRLAKLRELDPSAYKAYEWLQQQDDQRFRRRIYPPIMTQLDIERPDWAKYVESAINNRDLSAFICEDADDLREFTQSLQQELNLRVNVVMAPRESLDQFDSCDISRLKRYGVYSTVRDMFSAPDTVVAYLCKTGYLHQIPVGNSDTDKHFQNDLFGRFKRIYTGNSLHVITTSRYDQHRVTTSSAVREARYLNLTVDREQLTQINRKLEILTEKLTGVYDEIKLIEQQLADLAAESKSSKDKKIFLEQKKNEKLVLETKINEKLSAIDRYRRQSIDLPAIKRKTEDSIGKLEEKLIDLSTDLNKCVRKCVQSNTENLLAKLVDRFARQRQQLAERKLAKATNQFEGINQEIRRLEEVVHDIKREAKRLRDAAKDQSGFDVNDCDDQTREKFDSLPNTVDEIDTHIGTLRLRMNSILDADDTVRDQYNERQRTIERRGRDLQARQSELSDKQKRLDQLKNQWLPALEHLIDRINQNFGNFMDRLNYAGEVGLYKPPNDLESYDEYGISIKVKFRHTEQLRELTSFQSGGERSVSTMIYMIALQELTHVPFRCVDEINQGMDENNERSVFGLISETSVRTNSQYFLFSPKLLTNLSYTREMSIHIIFNGPHMEFDWTRLELMDDDEDDEEEELEEEEEDSDNEEEE
ncbi:structural maintenance of chromosomes protein 5-like [Oppia nitens]|uniref:structural maintenance of chromosomes protein 5-like n=1 Tax=Oppia nitens TaxID=1686743 RepID=UPI0023DAB846|nr:structural maintenance of chromosomes protein 5-like [Oppia nitens]